MRRSVAGVLSVIALAASFALRPAFGVTAAAYLALFVVYTRSLKHIVILDVMAIALGFVLRAVAGGLVIHVHVSNWLLVCTMLGALFLGLAKRRHEMTLLAEGAKGHRRILEEYDPYLLDQMIGVVAASTMVAYIIYCASPETHAAFGTEWMVLTTPFPIYGLFRYLYLVHRKAGGGSPSDMLLTDRPLLACVALWGVAVVLIVYRPFGPWVIKRSKDRHHQDVAGDGVGTDGENRNTCSRMKTVSRMSARRRPRPARRHACVQTITGHSRHLHQGSAGVCQPTAAHAAPLGLSRRRHR